MASAIAERHGGRVVAAPSATGATVVLELPLRTAEAPADPSPARRPRLAAFRRLASRPEVTA
jgi:hypothetical protein